MYPLNCYLIIKHFNSKNLKLVPNSCSSVSDLLPNSRFLYTLQDSSVLLSRTLKILHEKLFTEFNGRFIDAKICLFLDFQFS